MRFANILLRITPHTTLDGRLVFMIAAVMPLLGTIALFVLARKYYRKSAE
ncbi:MAG: hypothetical protein ACRD6B_04805 [Bryobacteraceae bacterium]